MINDELVDPSAVSSRLPGKFQGAIHDYERSVFRQPM